MKLVRIRHATATLLLVMVASSCSTTAIRGEALWRTELLALHEETLQAHRQSDTSLLLLNDDENYVLVNRGVISRPSLEERRERFSKYFGNTHFSEYRDSVPPIVSVSRDGSSGWVVVQIVAKGIQTGSDGTRSPVEFEAAWIELYKRTSRGWKRVGNVSNFKP